MSADLADEYALTHKLVFEKTMPQECHTKSDYGVSVQSGRHGASVGAEEKLSRELRAQGSVQCVSIVGSLGT